MEFLKNNARGIIISLLVAGAIIGIASISNDDTTTTQDTASTQTQNPDDDVVVIDGTSEEQATEGATTESEETASESTDGAVQRNEEQYSVTAQEGDSQTKIVRRIVEEYLTTAGVELGDEQMLYTETNLVGDLGRTDYIEVGTTFDLLESRIKQRVDEAQNLSEAAIARWTAYL